VRAVEIASMRHMAAAIEIAPIHSVMHATATMHAAAAMHPASAVARPSAAAATNLNQETVVHLRGGGPGSEHLDRFRLWRREA